ncbi:MAG: hypothetical protein M1368_00910 [Thaumarchaeota archaeon]|nr:hypothetical protein [Nitrososphaerota archaeon]
MPPQIPLLPDEQIVWSHEYLQGIFHRHPVQILAITNMRALIYEVAPNRTANADIRNVTATVMNEHRESQGLSYGTYYSGAARFGQFNAMRSGTSHAVGDIYFLENGQVVLKWADLNDPHSIVKLVEAVKKSMK